MKLFLLLLALFATSLACKCGEFDDKKSFCGADWGKTSVVERLMGIRIRETVILVSHVKITKKVSDDMTTHYTVKHIDTYKSPSSLKTLPCDIYTAAHTATCGVDVNEGEEYLLAGTYDSNIKQLKMATCGQFQPANSAGITIEEKMKWKNIPQQLRKNLKTYKC